MNRTVVIGGVVAVAVLLGVAAWLLIGGRSNFSSSQQLAGENGGPTILNPVDVVTDHAANQSADGRTLSITFPKFELDTKSGETKSAVFSTNWRLKLGPDERALVAVASFDGFMKSAAVPAPVAAPAPEAAKPATEAPATPPATSPADGATPAAVPPATAAPAKPETPPPAKPAAGDGVAHVIVTFGSDTSVTEWTDATGTGADHKFSKAAAFVGAPADLRDGATVPVTVTVELSGGTSADALARLNGIELRLFAETVPKPVEPTASQPATPATTDAAPAAPAAPGSSPTTPPADTGTTPAPAPEKPATP